MTSNKQNTGLLGKLFGSHRKKAKQIEHLELKSTKDADKISLSNFSISTSSSLGTPSFGESRSNRSGSIFDSVRKFFPDENSGSKTKADKSRPKISLAFHENEALAKMEKPIDEDEAVAFINGMPVNVYTLKRRKIVKKTPPIDNENDEVRVTYINGMPVNVYTDRVRKVVKKSEPTPQPQPPPPLNRVQNRFSMRKSVIYRQSVANFDYLEKAKELLNNEILNEKETSPVLKETTESICTNSSGSPTSTRSSTRRSFIKKRLNSSSRSNSNLGGLLSNNRMSREASPFPLDKSEIENENVFTGETNEASDALLRKEEDKMVNEICKEFENEQKENILISSLNTQENSQDEIPKETLFKKEVDEKANDELKQIKIEENNTFTDENIQEEYNEEMSINFLPSTQIEEIVSFTDILKEIEKDIEETNNLRDEIAQEKSQKKTDKEIEDELLDDSDSSNLFNRLISNLSSSSTDNENNISQIISPHQPILNEKEQGFFKVIVM
jgi:hypothetical protein